MPNDSSAAPPAIEDVAATVVAGPGPRQAAGPHEAPGQEDRLVEEEELGRGGMSVVMRVRDNVLGRTIALKRLDPAVARFAGRTVDFVQEARITAQLDHPNVVPIHDLGVRSDGSLFFTMKLVNGSSLSEWLAHPSRPVGSPERIADALDAFLKICDAVEFAHARGVVHRDLKPANVMVGSFGEVYVMDWGIAQTTRPVGAGASEDGDRQPAFGPYGTPAYMSPEAASGEPADERTDVFGLGAILYEIVTGRGPYEVTAGTHVLTAARNAAYTPVDEAVTGLPPPKRLVAIIHKALARDRTARHASAAELKRDVQAFVRGGQHLPRASFPPAARIVQEGDVGDTAFIILSGECEAYKTIDGKKVVLRIMGPGDVFGETAVLADQPRSATVEALTPMTVLVVSREALEEGLGLDTWLGALVRALAVRFRELDWRLHGR